MGPKRGGMRFAFPPYACCSITVRSNHDQTSSPSTKTLRFLPVAFLRSLLLRRVHDPVAPVRRFQLRSERDASFDCIERRRDAGSFIGSLQKTSFGQRLNVVMDASIVPVEGLG